MRKMFKILTPENVFLEYELAGIGSRFVAFFIDVLVQVGVIIVVLLAMLIGSVDFKKFEKTDYGVIGVGIILLFIVFYGYFIIFELAMNGQSLGKKVLKLRVIKQNGEPLGFFDSLLRNILRIADFLPALNLTGSIFIIFSNKYKRIGDYAANTIVVKIPNEDKQFISGIAEQSPKIRQARCLPDFILNNIINNDSDSDDEANMINIYPVNNFEYGILKEFLLRSGKLGKREPVFIYHLNNYFNKKFNIENNETEPNKFFQQIVKMNSGT